MANNLSSNQMRVDTAALIVADSKGETMVQGIQWVDDDTAAGGNVANGDNLSFTVNSVPVSVNCNTAAYAGSIVYQTQFFQPFRVFQLNVTAIDGGTLLIWKA